MIDQDGVAHELKELEAEEDAASDAITIDEIDAKAGIIKPEEEVSKEATEEEPLDDEAEFADDDFEEEPTSEDLEELEEDLEGDEL